MEKRLRLVSEKLRTGGITIDAGLAMLALIVGFLIVLISPVLLRKPASSHRMVSHAFPQGSVSQDISFEPGGAVDGITDEGCEFSSTGWRSSDGLTVFLKIYYCKSSANAEGVLNKLIKDATKVFEKKTLISKGRKTGERIVASFSKDLIKRPEMILWTEGSEIYMVESTSFAHALLLEKKFPNL